MQSISSSSFKLSRFSEIFKATPLLSNQFHGVWVERISRLIQPRKTLKLSHSFIKFSFTL